LRNSAQASNHQCGAATEQIKQITGGAAGANDDKEKPELN
jgi:hypothetical protein